MSDTKLESPSTTKIDLTIKPIAEETKIPEIKPIKCKLIQSDMPEEKKDEIFEYLSRIDRKIAPSQLAKGLNGYLCEKYGKGWNVFIGSNYYGLCSYEEKNYLEFEAVGFRVIIFKVFCPQ
ncbi:hypothetical protein CDIK_0637 [Cucumispora dikerogammari]|nr:hypothetical protein CDIK_0637 [Cucumispora dikerogammari]